MARKTTKGHLDPPILNNPVFINNYPLSLCHERTSTKSSTFTSVAFMYDGKWASFALPNAMLKQSCKRNGDVIPNCKNLFLGKPDEIRNVSVRTTSNSYETIQLRNSDILNIINQNRESYRASLTQ